MLYSNVYIFSCHLIICDETYNTTLTKEILKDYNVFYLCENSSPLVHALTIPKLLILCFFLCMIFMLLNWQMLLLVDLKNSGINTAIISDQLLDKCNFIPSVRITTVIMVNLI